MAIEAGYTTIQTQLFIWYSSIRRMRWILPRNRLILLRIKLILQGTTSVGESTTTKMRLVIETGRGIKELLSINCIYLFWQSNFGLNCSMNEKQRWATFVLESRNLFKLHLHLVPRSRIILWLCIKLSFENCIRRLHVYFMCLIVQSSTNWSY